MQIPASWRPPAPPGRYYVSDLIGCRVLEAHSGRQIGHVRGLVETGAAPVMAVEAAGREILIPFAASICPQIDTGQRTIRILLPDGLEDLNRG